MSAEFIAELRVKFLHPDGNESLGRIAVGAPAQAEEGEYSCSAVIDGLSTPPARLLGEDAFQALRLALQFLAWELHRFVEHGGRVVDLEGEDIGLPSIFGRLWAPVPPVPG